MKQIEQIDVLGVRVHRVGMSDALCLIEDFIRDRIPRMIVTANAEMIMAARIDPSFCNVMNSAGLVLPDGAGVVWASRFLGAPVPERVAGFDTVQRLLAVAAAKKYGVYWLGAAPGIAAAASAEAERRNPGLLCCGIRDGYFADNDESGVLQDIVESKPDILLCALGSPRQEMWLFRHLSGLGVPVAIGVGGTFDVMAGKVRRAPLWMQKASLEWLFRLAQQPKRAIRMLALPHFVIRVWLSAWTRQSKM